MLDFFIRKAEAAQPAVAEDRASASNMNEVQERLQSEVEQLGAELGKRVSDQLAIGQEEQQTYQIDKTRFLCCQVWAYLFNHRVTTLKSNGQGAYQIIDDSNEFLVRLCSDDPESPTCKRKVAVYRSFVTGIIKGVLVNLGAEGPIKCDLSLIRNDNSVYPRLLISLNYMEKRKPKD